jgi:GTP-binding protein
VTGAGVAELMNAVATILREQDLAEREAARSAPPERRQFTLDSVDERAWQVTRLSQHHFAVTGVGIERLTRMTDFAGDEAVERFQRVLDRSGINQELARQEIQPGDVVHIADHELIWGDQDDPLPFTTEATSGRGRRG